MRPYFEQGDIVLYHADAREILHNFAHTPCVVLTGPPWHEHPDVAQEVISKLRADTIICQWNEISRPPVSLPLVAVHIWLNTDSEGMRYQPFYHFDENGMRKRSAVMQYPTHNRTHPHDFPVALALCLLAKTPTLPVLDPFAGTGASLIAARQLKRKAIGIEIDEAKCAMAVERLKHES